MQPFDLVNRLERVKALDPIAAPIQKFVRTFVRPQWLRDVLHGVPIGHPAHPMLVQGTIGALMSSAVLDRVPGAELGADTLLQAGIVSAVPSVAAGLVDFSEQNPQHSRVGVVHAAANTTALAFFISSLVARRRGNRDLGRRLALYGLGGLSVGGLLGGHISFHSSGGASHAADVFDRASRDWQPVCEFNDLPDGKPVRQMLGDLPLFVLRDGNGAYAIFDVCSHLGGPLSDGELIGSGSDRCIVCPWHGSTFRIVNGHVVHGPATAPQPAFDVRVRDGQLEARLR